MKKKFFGFLMTLALVFSSLPVQAAGETITDITRAAGYQVTSDIAPKASIIIDAESGRILWGENIDLKRDPASTTKTMVIYLTFEAIAQGKITLDTEVVATQNDQNIAQIYALSNNRIIAGQRYTVRELLTMTLVPSSNVTTLMLAHLIFGNDDAAFIKHMNDVAKSLGMNNTVFYNATGAVIEAFNGYYAPAGYDPTKTNETTAKDLATLAYHLIKKYPEVLDFTNDTKVTVKAGTPLEETFESYNHSLEDDKIGIPGVDGLKTGSSPSAGYNAIVTAKRGDTRVITVVLGTSKWGDPNGEFVRHYFMNALMEKIFKEYKKGLVLPKGNHEIDGVKFTLQEDFYGLLKTGEIPSLSLVNNRINLSGQMGNVDPGAGATVTIAQNKQTGNQSGGNASASADGLLDKVSEYFPLILGFGLFLFLVFLLYLSKRRKK